MTIGHIAKRLSAITIVVGLLSGCGAAQNTAGTGNTAQPAAAVQNAQVADSAPNAVNGTSAAPGETADEKIHSGINGMLDTTDALSKALAANDAGKVAQLGDQLEEQWASFEDDVRPKYPEDYEQVEKFLDPLHAGTKASPLDVKTLTSLNDSLRQALQALQNKLS